MPNPSYHVRGFPQKTILGRLRKGLVRRCYMHLLGLPPVYRFVNHEYIRAFRLVDDLGPLTPVENRVVKDLRADGVAFAQIDEFFSDSTLSDFQHYFHEHLARKEAEMSANDFQSTDLDKIKPYLIRLSDFCVLKGNDIPTKVCTHPAFAKIAAHYMGMIPRFNGTNLWRTIPSPAADRIASQRWHRDYNDFRIVKVFLYLNDVTDESGPFEYLKGSHGGGRYQRVLANKFRKGIDRGYCADDELAELDVKLRAEHQVCSGKAGTLIFADTHGFHRGGKAIEGYRDVFVFNYFTNADVSGVGFRIEEDFPEVASPFLRKVLGIDR
jgi:hypothetical protein